MNAMQRSRGQRAVRQLEDGGWEEPLATLRSLFEMEDAPPRRKALVAITPPANKPESEHAWGVLFGTPLRFEPVISQATLTRYAHENPGCVLCWKRGAPHHLIYRSVVRLDLDWNLLTLCGEHHLNYSPDGIHFLGGRKWFQRFHRCIEPRYERRRVAAVLFFIKPWVERGGRESTQRIVTR